MGRVYNKVMADYLSAEEELSSCFFDFKMEHLTFYELLLDYKMLCENINGDNVLFISGLEADEDGKIESGLVLDFSFYAELFRNKYIPSDMLLSEAIKELGTVCILYRVSLNQDEAILEKGQLLDFIV